MQNLRGRHPSRPGAVSALGATLFALTLVAASLPSPVLGQQPTGSIAGEVRDAAGSLVRNASIIVTSKATGQTFHTTACADGAYAIEGLSPGDYEVKIRASYFNASVLLLTVAAGKITPGNVLLVPAGGGGPTLYMPNPDDMVVARYPLPDNGALDSVTLDGSSRKLYISAATEVEVVNADTGAVVGTIATGPGVHAVALAPPFSHGFIANGAEDQVTMFDASTLKLINKIDVGRGPDGIYYEPHTGRVFANNRGSRDITAIDARTGSVLGTIKADCDGKQAVIGAKGFIYVSSGKTNEVVVFDPKSLKVKKRFPIGVAKWPAGLVYDARTNRLLIGCRDSSMMVVMEATTGRVIKSYPLSAGVKVDYAGFDPGSGSIFFPNEAGHLDFYQEKPAKDYVYAGGVSTEIGSRIMALDPVTQQIFLPVVQYQFDRNKANSPMVPKPGTSAVIVVGQGPTGGIAGEVRDAVGALMSYVSISIKGKATGQTFEIVSLDNGAYSIDRLPPGDYDVTIEPTPCYTHRRTVSVAVTAGNITQANIGREAPSDGG